MFFTQRSFNAIAFSLLISTRHGIVAALPTTTGNPVSPNPNRLQERDLSAYSLPQNDPFECLRAAAIDATRAGFTYGPPVAGGPSYPSGVLGDAKVAADMAVEQAEAVPELALSTVDAAKALADANKYNGLKTVDDYVKLYDGEWTQTLPKGPAPGVLANYSQDLTFSMERLSTSPYALRRLNPASDSLAFQLDSPTAQSIAGMTLQQLFQEGRLFYVDHSAQATLSKTARFAAACDAYFYIDKASGNFLPLAIRTNVGANLIYTPRDSAADWQLAKIMFNVNDFLFAQARHLGATHEVIQIVWMAAIRTLSVDHPIYALLNRHANTGTMTVTYAAFSIQSLAATILFSKDGVFDSLFAVTGAATQDYATSFYTNGAGAFQANYFATDLENRGLINATYGPALRHFPFYEDASVIHGAIRTFMQSFVASYYACDAVVAADTELQNWVSEAHGAAKVLDFPAWPLWSRDTIVDVLTHMAHLGSSAHHAVNTNELLSVSGTLPTHPFSLYAPPPASKSANTSVAAFLPPLSQCVAQLSTETLFARRLLDGSNRTMLHMFDDAVMLARANEQTRTAQAQFQSDMAGFSEAVAARRFDASGLSQGCPFIWQALDPRAAPFSATI